MAENEVAPRATLAGRLFHLLVRVVPLIIIVLGIIVPPWSVLGKAHLIGYGICHQIPERTFFFNNHPLPLCARCSGIYLGAMVGFVGLLIAGRRRVGELPPGRVLLILGGFIVVMGIDGVNSYLTFFPNVPHLYEPQNWLRLATGMLNGLALSLIVYPVFNYTLWHNTERRPSIQAPWELIPFLCTIPVSVWMLESGAEFWLYPLSILSTGGVLLLLTMVNTMIVLILVRRESVAVNWRGAFLPLSWGLAVSFLELSVTITARAVLTQVLGLPF